MTSCTMTVPIFGRLKSVNHFAFRNSSSGTSGGTISVSRPPVPPATRRLMRSKTPRVWHRPGCSVKRSPDVEYESSRIRALSDLLGEKCSCRMHTNLTFSSMRTSTRGKSSKIAHRELTSSVVVLAVSRPWIFRPRTPTQVCIQSLRFTMSCAPSKSP